MKKLILSLIVLALAVPSVGFSINKFQRTGKIEKDSNGSYTEQQRDHHSRRTKQIESNTGAGYYDGAYHSKTDDFEPGEWQFVKSKNLAKKKVQKKQKQ